VTPAGGGTLRVSAGDLVKIVATDTVIGRDPTCDIVIEHALVSRTHAALRYTPLGWVVEDRGSRNGIWVSGERVNSINVGSAVVVQLGAADGPSLDVRPVVEEQSGDIRVGRDPDGTIVLDDDLLVSRRHAVIRTTSAGVEIQDLDSHNGTFVNGHRVTRTHLNVGDVVAIGQHRFFWDGSGLRPATDSGEQRLVASGLVVRAPSGQVLLQGVDISVAANSFLAVVGPSGAGKSTLLNALTGFRPANEGTVWVGGRDLYAEYDDLRRGVGLVPQEDVLHPQLTVRKTLSYAAQLRFPPEVSKEERDRRVEEVMQELGLTERADLRVDQLSGGQRKRASVAVELLTKPSLLFLDEPTSGLDPGYERSLMQLLRDLANSGRTIIVVTHSVASLHLCDKVLVMAPGGRVAFVGPPAEALVFFGQDDYQGVFQALTDSKDIDWPARWAAANPPGATQPDHRSAVAVPRPPKAGLGQFGTLTRRYVSVLRADRVTLTLLALQAPVIGLLQLVVLPRHELAPPAPGTLRVFSSAAAILLNPVQVATALGLANSVRELVKERGLFRRERAAGLSLPAYLGSKVFVLGTVAIIQAAILVAFSTINEGGPRQALALGRPYIELTAVIALTGIAATTLGLMISSLAPTENLAMVILPMVLILQNVLSMGGLSPSSLEKPVLNQAQYASSAQWGFAAEAATADLNHLQGLSAVFKQVQTIDLANASKLLGSASSGSGPSRYGHERQIWFQDMAALAALAIAAILVTALALGRLDPSPPPRPAGG
jgi:ABC transport system ATP-binding/permease protein